MQLKLVMTLLVRDEIDIVRQNIEFHLARGVDHVIATDNGSVDGTREVLADFERRGVATVLDEPGRDYLQGKWVTRMALMARDRFGADWILNNDADEFWCSATGKLKSELLATDADILVCERRNMVYAHDEDDSGPWHQRLLYRIASPVPVPRLKDSLADQLPCPYFYFALGPKVMTRARGLKKIEQGNHSATYEGESKERNSDVIIYHFPVRSSEQFKRKILQGGEAYAQNTELPVTMGWHWRRWYLKLAAEGLTATIADALPSGHQLKRDLSEGLVVEDFAIRKLLCRLPSTKEQ